MSQFSRMILAGALLMFATAAVADPTVLVEVRHDMGAPLDAETAPWERVGAGHTLVMNDESLLINDNSRSDNIAFQTLLGEIKAEHRVTLQARVKVLSNLQGQGATMEIARPGVEVIVRLYPDRVELVERRGREFRWLAGAPLDLSEYRELEFVKTASDGNAPEPFSLFVDGERVLQATPQGGGELGVGRLLVGSLSMLDIGASQWDWLSYRVESGPAGVTVIRDSFGAIKARFGG